MGVKLLRKFYVIRRKFDQYYLICKAKFSHDVREYVRFNFSETIGRKNKKLGTIDHLSKVSVISRFVAS